MAWMGTGTLYFYVGMSLACTMCVCLYVGDNNMYNVFFPQCIALEGVQGYTCSCV